MSCWGLAAPRAQKILIAVDKKPKLTAFQRVLTAQPRPRPFLSSSRGAPFFFFGAPPDDTHQMPLLHAQWNTEKPQRFFIWRVPSIADFWCGIRCKFFLENYGCGCVGAVPDFKEFWLFLDSILDFLAAEAASPACPGTHLGLLKATFAQAVGESWVADASKCRGSHEGRASSVGAKHWTQTFFSQTFRALPGYPSKIPGYPAKKVWFPGFRGTYRTFWPPPLHMEDPHPTRKYPDSKV